MALSASYPDTVNLPIVLTTLIEVLLQFQYYDLITNFSLYRVTDFEVACSASK